MNRQQHRQNQRIVKKKQRSSLTVKSDESGSDFVIDDDKVYTIGEITMRGHVLRELVEAGYISQNGHAIKSELEIALYVYEAFPDLKFKVLGAKDETDYALERELNTARNTLNLLNSVHDETEKSELNIDDRCYYKVGGLTLGGERIRELIKADFVSKNGTPLRNEAEMLYHLTKVFPDFKLKTLPDDQKEEANDNYFKDQTFPIVNNENNINDNDEEQDAILKARIVIQSGIEAKRRGDYKTALERYEEAIAIAPGYLPCYYALGKLHYLLNDKEASLLNYTVAAHLHASLGPAQDLNDDLKEIKDSKINKFPDNLIAQFRSVHRQAVMLLIDDKTPKHVGHTLIDLPTK